MMRTMLAASHVHSFNEHCNLTKDELFELLEGIRVTNDTCDELDSEESHHDRFKVEPIDMIHVVNMDSNPTDSKGVVYELTRQPNPWSERLEWSR